MKHKLFCVVGRTSSGKTEITKAVASELSMKVVKSYATRPMRESETIENSDHIFIKTEEVEHYRDDMAAYTKIGDAEYFTTVSQLMDSDFYVIDPQGIYFLKEKMKDTDIKIVVVYISRPTDLRRESFRARGETAEKFRQRNNDEDAQFTQFEKEDYIDYRILNNGKFEDAVFRMKRILDRESQKGD